MASKHKMPRTPSQFLALSLFGCLLLGGVSLWNYVRHDMTPLETLSFEPVPDKPLLNKANKHLIYVPFLSFIIVGGVVGAGVVFIRRQRRTK